MTINIKHIEQPQTHQINLGMYNYKGNVNSSFTKFHQTHVEFSRDFRIQHTCQLPSSRVTIMCNTCVISQDSMVARCGFMLTLPCSEEHSKYSRTSMQQSNHLVKISTDICIVIFYSCAFNYYLTQRGHSTARSANLWVVQT